MTYLDRAELRRRALGLLARREYSRAELARKLGCPQELLDELAAEGLQSDDRFAESLVRSLVARGKGPLAVRQALRQKGIASGLAETALEAAEVDWYRLACEVRRRRFGALPARDPGARAKQGRFLAGRGFDADQIRHALEHDDAPPDW